MERVEALVHAYEDLARFRRANIALIDSVTPDKLQTIPSAFNNSIFWQAGHLVTTQASLLYRRTGQQMPIPESYFKYFAKGTSPSDFDSDTPGFDEIYPRLESILETTREDIPRMSGLPYSEAITVTSGRQLASFDDALEFIALHEAYHMGMITAMLKFLK